MQKIRKKYVENFKLNKKCKSRSFIRYCTFANTMAGNLAYSKINYLTFDEIKYLHNNLDKSSEEYKIILEEYKKDIILIDKFYDAYLYDKLDNISYEEMQKIQILFGFIKDTDIFGEFIKDRYEFNFTYEEILMKETLKLSMALTRIKNKKYRNPIGLSRYKAIMHSYIANSLEENNQKLDDEFSKHKINMLFSDLIKGNAYDKFLISPKINDLYEMYLNEVDSLKRGILSNTIREMIEEVVLLKELIKNGKYKDIDPYLLMHYYLPGSGSVNINGLKIELLNEKEQEILFNYFTENMKKSDVKVYDNVIKFKPKNI